LAREVAGRSGATTETRHRNAGGVGSFGSSALIDDHGPRSVDGHLSSGGLIGGARPIIGRITPRQPGRRAVPDQTMAPTLGRTGVPSRGYSCPPQGIVFLAEGYGGSGMADASVRPITGLVVRRA
jgi:hypothetical protein